MDRDSSGPGCIIAVAAIGIIAIIAMFFLTFKTVPSGYVGVITTWGKAENTTLEPGLHLVVPISQNVVNINTQVQVHEFKDINGASQEYQSVNMSGKMNYHLDGTRASELYQRVGLGFADNVIDPAFTDVIKEVLPKYPAEQILGKRDEIRSKAKDLLNANLVRYGITVDDIYLKDINFSPEYQAAIEAKQTAQQNVSKEEQILAQKQIQAQQAVVDAQGKADAAVATAKGEAQANQVRTASINPELIDYLRWQKWDGKLPQVLGANSPLINVSTDATPTPKP